MADPTPRERAEHIVYFAETGARTSKVLGLAIQEIEAAVAAERARWIAEIDRLATNTLVSTWRGTRALRKLAEAIERGEEQ